MKSVKIPQNKTCYQEQDETSQLRFPTWQFLVIVASYLAIQNQNNTWTSAQLKRAHCFRDVVS
jgi:hypothetical protein